ncbi:sugar ABC transporter substrate-binding protein [Micromonospora sp. KC723]|uniref:ABC transporter substrate-binding protein n=1 Tax=Micromonospora sp. KC723 TaxID=2530381 RepID=UPI00104FAA21|nr:sugar ABC transporter substrate-binding protein [Micromonospora sp. KC723]TDB72176.1 sugar ABC transporter substrate-binding protein [Micromonospora sp. KC723]
MTKARRALAAAAALGLLTVGGCSGSDDSSKSASGTITYWLWDTFQQPQYQACADAFHAANPQYKVKITQYGWDDYWNTLTSAFVSGTAPDTFISHLSYYPQYAAQSQLLDITEQVKKDNVDLSQYQNGLADLWVDQQGRRFGLPKDFDTVALFYNTKKVEEAGVKTEDLQNLTWNPTDGGTYERLIARLTVDKNGKRGDEPGFDKTKVATYGLGLNSSGGGFGQTEWSQYAFSTGWTHGDKTPWPTRFNYDDPRFKQTIAWFRSLVDRGYMPTLAIASSGVNQMDAYGAGKYAMVTEGSWNTKSYWDLKGVKSGIAPTPIGPIGKRASMINGLADNIYAGTKNPEGAWQWVKFLASPACQQDIVAKQGIVFPAMKTATVEAERAFAAKQIDVAPFTVHIKENTTTLAPIADHWADISALMTETMDSILSGKSGVDSLDGANRKVNEFLKK